MWWLLQSRCSVKIYLNWGWLIGVCNSSEKSDSVRRVRARISVCCGGPLLRQSFSLWLAYGRWDILKASSRLRSSSEKKKSALFLAYIACMCTIYGDNLLWVSCEFFVLLFVLLWITCCVMYKTYSQCAGVLCCWRVRVTLDVNCVLLWRGLLSGLM